MLSIFDETLPEPCPAPFNMAAYVLAAAQENPDKPALGIVSADGADWWSFARLESAVLGVATGFRTLDLPQGAPILLRLGNTVDFPLAFLGAIAAGYLPVPTSAQLTGPEITKMAQGLNPVAVVAGDGIALPDVPVRVIPARDLETMFDLPRARYSMGDPNRPAYVIYTSGSGGSPKAVCHAHRAVWARRMMFDGWYGLTAQDRLLHAGAFNWTYTLGTGLMDPWAAGACALIAGGSPAPADLPQLLKDYNATIFAAAPGVYRQMLKSHTKLDLPDLRHGLSAGEKLSPVTAHAWTAATGTPVFEALGMSECSTFISGSPAHPAPEGASGYPQPGRRIAVLDGDNHPVDRGEPGQLAVSNRDPGLMLGYLNDAKGTAERFDGEWFLTGDTVAMAADGAITYLGRNDDMMNAGGFRVSPVEVEAALAKHPAIHEVAVTELPIKEGVTVIGAFYTGSKVIEQSLKAFAATALARYKQPRLYVHVETLPRGGNSKLNRRALRENWTAQHDQA